MEISEPHRNVLNLTDQVEKRCVLLVSNYDLTMFVHYQELPLFSKYTHSVEMLMLKLHGIKIRITYVNAGNNLYVYAFIQWNWSAKLRRSICLSNSYFVFRKFLSLTTQKLTHWKKFEKLNLHGIVANLCSMLSFARKT